MEEVQYCQKKSPGRACYGRVIGLAFRESDKTWAFIGQQWIGEKKGHWSITYVITTTGVGSRNKNFRWLSMRFGFVCS